MSTLESTEDAMDRRGDQAWDELKTNPDWLKWLAIGESMMRARASCMHDAQCNRPLGRGYNEAFSRWLAKRRFGKMDGGDRSRLFECMDNRVAIEAWRATLTDTERLRLNHPSTVLRKWKSATKLPEITKEQKPSPVAQLKEAHAVALEENHTLKKQIERGDGNLFTRDTTAREAARLFVGTFSVSKWKEIVREANKLIAAKERIAA